MTNFRVISALTAVLLLTSCALRAQQGTLRGERVIVTNQDASVYPPNDVIIRTSGLNNRVLMGIGVSDDAIIQLYNDSNNKMIEISTIEAYNMLSIRNDPGVEKVAAGIVVGGTALDMGALQVLGEDRASGLDAYTSIQGGDVTSNTLLVRTTNAGEAYVQWDDTAGSGGLVTISGYDGSGASYQMYWPGVSFASASCGGTCIIEIDDSTGQMSFAAPPSGGGTSSGVATTIQLSDGSGGFTSVTGLVATGDSVIIPAQVTSPSTEGGNLTLAGDTTSGVVYNLDVYAGDVRIFANSGSTRTFQILNAGAGDLDVTLGGDLNFGADSTYDVASASVRVDEGFFDNVISENVFFRRQGQPSQDYVFTNDSAAVLTLRDAAAALVWQVDGVNGWIESAYHLIPNPASRTLGTTSQRWANYYGTAADLYGSLTLSTSGGSAGGRILATSTNEITLETTTGTDQMIWRSSLSQVLSKTLVPIDGTSFLGTTSSRWDSYLGDVVIYDTLLPDTSGGATIGSVSLPFGTTYLTTLTATTSVSTVTANIGTASSAGKINIYSPSPGVVELAPATVAGGGISDLDLEIRAYGTYPKYDNQQHLGWSSRRWTKTWTYDLDQAGNATISIGSGSFYGKMHPASFASSSCSGVTDGYLGVTTDQKLLVCVSNTKYGVALSTSP